MNSIATELDAIKKELPSTARLVAVSKFHPAEMIREAYDAGQRIFGENRPQELAAKVKVLPEDIEWHFIGHLQSNKLKMVLPYASLIHSVDSVKLLDEIDKFAVNKGLGRVRCLLEVYIAQEESKHGMDGEEVLSLLDRLREAPRQGVEICGLMGMASFVKDESQIRREFSRLSELFRRIRSEYGSDFPSFTELSMGMSGDYRIALEYGSTLVRIGTRIFGVRNY